MINAVITKNKGIFVFMFFSFLSFGFCQVHERLITKRIGAHGAIGEKGRKRRNRGKGRKRQKGLKGQKGLKRQKHLK